MNNIHPTAIVSSKAKLGDNITIAPYAIIEDDVEIGNDCQIGPSAVVYNGARIGNRVKIKQSASVSHLPQDLKFQNEVSHFYVGDDTVIHEFATLHRGTIETGFSRIGKKCLIMAYSHVAHDCVVGDNVILANGVQLAGHVFVDDWAILGGMCGVHQFCKIGKHAMMGVNSVAVKDVPPFVLCGRVPIKFEGLNVIGLRRRGFSNQDIDILKKVYNYIYNSGLNVSDGIAKVESEFPDNKHVNDIISFVKSSKRGIIGK
ncbi:MAG: acyl-ACP--UDP-N-acetylglucosamine O-acyltransferase [Ignavibacteriaceae bacterium]|jgi:UDP-N-acetylglucosamine acyltransferase|nr:acyl-ACP--UDP-N-acetylglucosamine O-acyltransferase [Ignavibacteriaceae bacterium]